MYRAAESLIEHGHAYVDSQTAHRGGIALWLRT
jgi:glutamyl/glutaminyl-tRNA synthetase